VTSVLGVKNPDREECSANKRAAVQLQGLGSPKGLKKGKRATEDEWSPEVPKTDGPRPLTKLAAMRHKRH